MISIRLNHKSISFKLIIGVIAIMVPLIAILIYNNQYSIKVIQKKVAESNKNMLTLYMTQIDMNLTVVSSYLANMIASDNFASMDGVHDEQNGMMAETELFQQLTNDITSFKTLDTMFFYNKSTQDFIYGYNTGGSFAEREMLKTYITSKGVSELNPPNRTKWDVRKIGDNYYLLLILQKNELYLGAWLNVKKLMIPLKLIDMGEEGASVLVTVSDERMITSNLILDSDIEYDSNAKDYYFTGRNNRYLAVGQQSNVGDFSLFALIPNKKLLEKLPYLQYIVNAIGAISVLLLVFLLIVIRRIVLLPLRWILSTVKKIREGDIKSRIRSSAGTEEFQNVNDAINDMLDEIHDLKIDIYEEQIGKQKAELEHLQMQVNPHFFLNSLNSIHSLAKVKRYDLILELSDSLIHYFRYMFRSDTAFVPLKDELSHAENYMKIQKMRYDGCLNYSTEVSEFILDIPVPPFIIQTFVENSIKHGMTLDHDMLVSIQAGFFEKGAEPFIRIVVKDNGNGFSKDVLDKLHLSNDQLVDEDGIQHVGIWNAKRRLQLLYASRAEIVFSNDPNHQGAVVEMMLPMNPKEVSVRNDAFAHR